MCRHNVFYIYLFIYLDEMRTSDLPIALTVVVDNPTNVLLSSLHEQTERQIVRRISWDGCLCDDMIHGMSHARSTSRLAQAKQMSVVL